MSVRQNVGHQRLFSFRCFGMQHFVNGVGAVSSEYVCTCFLLCFFFFLHNIQHPHRRQSLIVAFLPIRKGNAKKRKKNVCNNNKHIWNEHQPAKTFTKSGARGF